MGRYTMLSEDEKTRIDDVKEAGRLRYEIKQDRLAEDRARIQKAGLSYRYFRNHKSYHKRNVDHKGVICIGYKIIDENEKGIVFTFCVAFCSPKDSFSRFEAKKRLSERYNKGNTVSVTVSYGSGKEFESIIKSIWNSQKIPLEKLGIRSPAPGKMIKLKKWMKFIR